MLLSRGNQASTSVNSYQKLTILQPCPILVSDVQQLTSRSFCPISSLSINVRGSA